jgi:hypothetical protein
MALPIQHEFDQQHAALTRGSSEPPEPPRRKAPRKTARRPEPEVSPDLPILHDLARLHAVLPPFGLMPKLLAEPGQLKRCAGCGTAKGLGSFRPGSGRFDLGDHCKTCRNALARAAGRPG